MKRIFMQLKRKYNLMTPGVKSAFVFAFASFVQQGISFLFTPLYTRLMPQADYGIISTYNSWVEIIGVFAMMSLSSGVFTVGMIDFKNDRDGFTSSMLTLSNLATLFVGGVYIFAYKILVRMVVLPNNLILLMFLYFLFQPAILFWVARQRYEYKYKKPAIITVLMALFSQVSAIICILASKKNLGEAKLWGATSITILFGIGFWIYIYSKGRKSFFNKKYLSYAIRFALPLIPHYLSMHILAASDKVMITNMIGSSATAIYALSYTVSSIVNIAWSAINGSLTPYVHGKLESHKYSDIPKVAVPAIIGFSSVCFLAILFAPEIIMILGGKSYYEGIYIIPPVIAGILFSQMYNLFATVEFFYKKTTMIMVSTLIAAVTNIVLNFIFIPMFGYIAAAYTTLASYALYAFLHYLNMRRACKEKIYSPKFLILFSISYVSLCLLMILTYQNTIVRYGFIAAIVILAIIFRKKIIGFYKKIKGKNSLNEKGESC